MTGRRLLVSVVVLIGSACTLGGLILLAVTWSDPVPEQWGFRGFLFLFALSYGSVGTLLALRKPGNVLSWVLLVSGLEAAIQMLAQEYATYGILGRASPLPGAVAAGWIESWIWLLGVTTIVTYSLLLFPTGSFVSPRWRVVGWIAAANLMMGIAGLAFAAGPLNNAPFIDNPFPVLGEEARSLFVASYVGLGLLATAAAASLVIRYRRARGVERQQLKWLVLAGVLIAIALFTTVIGQLFDPASKPPQVLFIVVLASMPIAIGLAVLRYRLYDIDVLINRAIVYAATTASIGAAFFAGIVVLQAALRPFTGGSEIAVAASTLFCFALFQPVRGRIQAGIDRRFYRSRVDAGRILDAFGARLSDEVDLDSVRVHLLGAVDQTMSPAHASVWLRGANR